MEDIVCRQCGLINDSNKKVCDCGWNLVQGLVPEKEREAREKYGKDAQACLAMSVGGWFLMLVAKIALDPTRPEAAAVINDSVSPRIMSLLQGIVSLTLFVGILVGVLLGLRALIFGRKLLTSSQCASAVLGILIGLAPILAVLVGILFIVMIHK